MIWDAVIAVGGVVTGVAALRMLASGSTHIARTSSVSTAAALTAFCVSYAALGLYLALATTVVTAIAWWGLVVFRGPLPIPVTMSAEWAWRADHE